MSRHLSKSSVKHFSPHSEDVTGAASLGVLVPRPQQWNNGGTVSAAAVEMNVTVKNRGTKILGNII